MSKTKDELLLAYRKANKQARKSIVTRAGFQTEAEYITYLMEPEVTAGSPAAAKLFKHNRVIINNVFIVDLSSSMNDYGKLPVALKGINDEMEVLKKDPNAEYLITIVEFSDPEKIRVAVDRVPLKDMKTYSAIANGWTALYQATGETLERMKGLKKAGEAVLVKIFTDGGENKSRGKYSSKHALSQMIKECEDDGFTITFVGTETDVKTVIDSLGVDESNTHVHFNDTQSIGETFALASSATLNYSRNLRAGKSVKKGFYKKLK
jgi:hypothetical protein